MPEITLITAMRVVVARMIPSNVRKLRSLLPRREWSAPFTASQNDACDVIRTCDEARVESLAVPGLNPFHYHLIEPETVGAAAQESKVAAEFGNHQLDGGMEADGFGLVYGEGYEGVVLGLDHEAGTADRVEEADGRLQS